MNREKGKNNIDYQKMTWKALKITAYAALLLAAAALLVFGGIRGYSFGYEIFHSEPLARNAESAVSTELSVEEGETASEIGRILQEKGIISSMEVFFTQVSMFDIQIEPGTYTVDSYMSSREILSLLDKKE